MASSHDESESSSRPSVPTRPYVYEKPKRSAQLPTGIEPIPTSSSSKSELSVSSPAVELKKRTMAQGKALGKVRLMRQTSSIMENVKAVIDAYANKLMEQVVQASSTFSEEPWIPTGSDVKRLKDLADAVATISREERELAKMDNIEDLSDSELVRIAEEAAARVKVPND